MNYSFNNNSPIYLQIVEIIEREIISGARSPGEIVESVRELAAKLRVNPNTVQKALVELEEKGLVETERTSGRFVTKNENKLVKLREKYFKEKTENYLSEMKKIKIEQAKIIDFIKNNYEN